jgi:hypothetical protein
MYRLGQELLHVEKHGIPIHLVSIKGRTPTMQANLGLAIYLHPTGSYMPVQSTMMVASSPWS